MKKNEKISIIMAFINCLSNDVYAKSGQNEEFSGKWQFLIIFEDLDA